MNFLVLLMFSIGWLRDAGAQGEIADVTGRLSGEKIELDYPGRRPGDSKLRLLKISELRLCVAGGEILPDDLVLIFGSDGKVLHAGKVTSDGHLGHLQSPAAAVDSVSTLSVAAYCARWRTAAGVKILRKPWLPYHYTKKECFVPMRDGTRLYTAVYEAEDAGPKPILMVRNPYPVGTYGYGGVGDLSDKIRCFTERGYIIVEQNVRGTYMSEGDFVDVRPLTASRRVPAEGDTLPEACKTDEATDTYDTIEWLLKNTCNNGSVGIYGVSYPGFYATLAALCGHPALKAVSPQAPVTDWWMGDDTHHNGAFMLCDMYGFGGAFFRPKGNPTPDWRESLSPVPDGADLYTFFKGKSMRSLLRPFLQGGEETPLKGFADIKAHPGYDSFWQERNPLRHLREVKPAVMVVGGLYDAEDAWGAVHTYRALCEQSPETDSYFVFGPWTHGGWRKDGDFLENIELPFFEYYLEGKGAKPAYRELVIPSGEPGENLAEGKPRLLNPKATGERRFAVKAGKYVSDPANPVPYMDVQGPWRDKAYMWADQRFASERPDVLTQTLTAPLRDTLWAVGPVKVFLRFKVKSVGKAAKDSLDADFVVKLIDQAPDGTQNLVRGDVAPARWRESLEKATPLKAGETAELSFEMVDVCHCFAPGHRLVLQVQSSWFPLVAMNPQSFVSNPYTASTKDYRPVEVRILPGSAITLGVL